MNKVKFSHRVIAVFLTVSFLSSIFPSNFAYASNGGPGSPEAAGFEPVDATDMVNLTNGNLSYVLPLMSVEDFPVTLSYHAGITTDMDASWAGLGWYINPGAINRSVTNTPDDWKSGVGINFTSFYQETTSYGVSVEVGFPGAVSVGVGMNWGGGQGLSGSVNATVGIGAGTGGMVQGGVSAGISTTGDATIGAGIGIDLGGNLSAGVGLSYSLKNQWNLSGGISSSIGESGAYVGASISTSGGFSIGGAGNNKAKGDKVGGNSGGVGMSSSSFSQGDASIDVQNTGVAVPLHFVGIPITLGFRKQKVKINIKKGYLNQEWGVLYSSDYSNISSEVPRITSVSNYNEHYTDYMVRTKSMDTYSSRLPQLEEEFISDYSKTIENINFTYMAYDDYNVSAQGLMGSMTPNVFQNSSIYGKGQVTKNEAGKPIHAFWHHGSSNTAVDKKIDRINGSTVGNYTKDDFHFYFNGQFTGTEKNSSAGFFTGLVDTATTFDALINEGVHIGTSTNNAYQGRAKSPNYVEVFTNNQIASGHATARGLITPSTIPNSDRSDISKFDPDGIGAYKITSPDGKTYHFSLPVYHYEQIHRSQINNQENSVFDIGNVNEKRQFTRYATHWLLTAITGSDYIDQPDPNLSNTLNTFNKEDYGYWVELEYGKWSDGFVWRSPYKDRTYNYNTNLKGDIEDKDKGGYSFGRKQLYYLDKINTKNRTALFIKDIREDNFGKALNFKFSNSNNGGLTNIGNTGNGSVPQSLNYTNPSLYVKESGISYKREYSLKLSKIILVDSDFGKSLSKDSNSTTTNNLASTLGNFNNTYIPNDYCTPGWESPYFTQEYGSNYGYYIHNEAQILDSRDVSSSFIQNNALKVVEFNHSYDLAKNSPSSSEVVTSNNSLNGRLTLDSVMFKGKGGTEYMPATAFEYYMEDMQNIQLPSLAGGMYPNKTQIKDFVEAKAALVDSWGFIQDNPNYQSNENEIKAWSLKEITMPTGAKIEINYEEDDYWMEAFSRRFWQDGLEANFTQENGIKYVYFRQQQGTSSDVIDFTNYFNLNSDVFLDIQYHRNPSTGSHGRRIADFAGSFDLVSVSNSEIKIQLPTEQNNHDRTGDFCGSYPWSYTAYYCCSSNLDVNEVGYIAPMGGSPCDPPGNGSTHFRFKLLANKIPESETGGGLRVSEVRTISDAKTYKIKYDYSHPTENRSSGITSYAPVDGLKFVPYETEVPGPGVMYEYVTMTQTSNDDEYYSKTRYRHHVLKPVFNIFNPEIEMEALDANATGEDKIFWANVTEDYAGMNGNNSKNIEAKKVDIHINTALLGQLKSIENLNSYDHVMMRTENEYINGNNLISGPNSEPNKGYTKETFNSMKTIFQTNNEGTVVENVKRLLSISSRTEYNNMLKKTNTYALGSVTSVEYDDVDGWLGSYKKSITTLPNGLVTKSYKIPAYEKYPNMQSRIINHNNKNMLTQEAMTINEYAGGTLSASLTTWNDQWEYTDATGNTNIESGVWRKHKSFVWKDDINPTTGVYSTSLNSTNDYFNWGIGAPTSNKWQNISEITKYTHWSSPIETRDINNNFASSKMADNFSKVEASGNARLSELYFSGAEYQASGNFLTDNVQGAQYRHLGNAHTGDYSLSITSPGAQFFKVQGDVGSDHGDISKTFRPGKYKISIWADVNTKSHSELKLMFNGNEITSTEVVRAGDWILMNYYIDLSSNSTVDLYFTTANTNAQSLFYDDFRMHPIHSSMNSYIYNQSTDELISILDANNLATLYCYDSGGRLCSTYTEVVDTVSGNGSFNSGGFKVVSQNKYNYKNSVTSANCSCTF
ncbi:hypothetical protein DFQ05_1862 [Winogradskyella wandonensis]|uniref:YD repeat-containing protein n=1 Tax=Winogradskyella wandonensis TaxID=1442586 RepID=A0A4R1KU56_9FLAO|nr:hypothetical protein [Winogradskyella wandonensis]TCK68077.1 hypothetical protein DFQ05_1862 [Winogradskyella wandonensis]